MRPVYVCRSVLAADVLAFPEKFQGQLVITRVVLDATKARYVVRRFNIVAM